MEEIPFIQKPPITDTKLLNALCQGPDQVRWMEFSNVYTPVIRYYLGSLREKYKSIQESMFDDIVQETLITLMKAFPDRKYDRGQGKFHSFLYGIVRNKALKATERVVRGIEVEMPENMPEVSSQENDAALERYQNTNALLRMLVDRVFEGNRWSGKSKEIFLRLTMENAKPRDLAREYGMKENAIYQLKNRVMKKLKEHGDILKRSSNDLVDLIEIMAKQEVFHDPE